MSVIRKPIKQFQLGFTLVELMVTIAIVAIALAIALPSFTQFVRTNELTGTRDKLIASFQYARTEAVNRNADIALCPSTDSATCTNGSDWADGWIVYIDTNSGMNSTVGTLIKVVQEDGGLNVAHAGLTAGLTPTTFIRYVPQGFASYLAPITAQTICFTDPEGNVDSQGIVVSAGTGQVRPVGGC